MSSESLLTEQLQREIQQVEARLPTAPRGSKEAILAVAGLWVGDSEELDRLLAEVERDRELDAPAGEISKP